MVLFSKGGIVNLPVSNLERSIEFYKKLGLPFAWRDEDTTSRGQKNQEIGKSVHETATRGQKH